MVALFGGMALQYILDVIVLHKVIRSVEWGVGHGSMTVKSIVQ